LAKTVSIKPEEARARAYADRLILTELTELHAAVKLSELSDRLLSTGIGLGAVRSLLASNPRAFAYAERRWIPAARLEAEGRPMREAIRLMVDRFGGPMPTRLVLLEISHRAGRDIEIIEPEVRRLLANDPDLFVTPRDEVVLANWVFRAHDESPERAYALNRIQAEDVEAAIAQLGPFDWRAPDAIVQALHKLAPIDAKVFGAVAWRALNPADDPRAVLLYDWRAWGSELLSAPGYVYGPGGVMHQEADAKKWISVAVKLADKLAPTVEIEDATPIEIQPEDVSRMVDKIAAAGQTVTATQLLEEFYEITPSVKTFPDDLANILVALKAQPGAWWVGGDRFRALNSAPDFITEVPEPFQYVTTDFVDDEGEPVDFELSDDGLSTSLRKLIMHPLATDVLDEETNAQPKAISDQLRLVLKPIHRELGTFPLAQLPTGWLDPSPDVQEVVFVNPEGQSLSVWANLEVRLLFNLIDWWFDQPIESGAVFTLARTNRPNVFEFEWLDQPDPVVYISTQRMEELRAIASQAQELSTLEILKQVMTHWPKGADFLTILWEVNVVRRSRRRLVASLLSSYHCFYQRSGSPVWHYDAKRADQGVDKTKKKFILK
jgi:hypothetical protein